MQRGACFAAVRQQAPFTASRMPGRAALLVLALGLAATAQKSTLTLDPPWSTMFRGESVTLMCSTSHRPGQRFTWYRNEELLRRPIKNSYRIEKTQMRDTGRYQCQASGSRRSDPVQLTISNDWLILQAPYYAVFEGDPLRLRCYGWNGAKVSWIRYYKDEAEITPSRVNSELSIKQARTRDSGKYHCTGSMIFRPNEISPSESISVQELFSTPVLRAAGSGDPIEGSPVTLSCVTQLNPQKSDTLLQRFFYIDNRALGEPRSSPDYHIPVAGLQDSGSYYCYVQTVTSSVRKRSPELKIAVKRIPVSQVSLEVQPLGGQVTEGEWLMLNCSVSMGTGPITFSWHREGSRQALRTETQSSQRMVYEMPAATETDTGEYYCMASNGNVPAPSPRVKVAVKVPVSPPQLTVSTAGAWAAIGDVVEIRCESPRGSSPILYRFHHEGAALGSRTVSSRGPGSLALNVTSERDSGTYSCEADNGMASGPQHSDPFHLSVLVPVSGATIAADRMGPEVMAGESLNLSCSVESGTTPLFKWLHNAQELAAASGLDPPTAVGNTLHFGSVQLGHGGNYQCIASNQLSPQRVFQAPSEILAITVIEHASPLVVVPVTVSILFLFLMGVTAALVFYFKCWKKTEGMVFNAPGRHTQLPAQHEPPGQRLPPPGSLGLHAEEPSYGNVCPLEPESGDVEYTVVNIKKRSGDKPKGTPPRDNEEYYVSYSVLPDPKPTWESAAGARAPEGKSLPDSDIYENVPHL
ncbi:Fc receptor-like protein 3 isoform X2 [Mauremys reevesii]|uniref:Fc receptor-like protein 3 isoform X2 n=1 Tax=Mauremys reevesii TaxID=260615 RepID=UPI00193EEE5E|nr:Fc receptor-like protein 3 isoform X2 [Mauremys reevesii]